jgi:hypothetical protein
MLSFIFCELKAQNLSFDVDAAGIGANGVIRFNDPSLMGEKAGVKVDYTDIRGNCFFESKWNLGIVRLRNKTAVKFSKLRLNSHTNQIHYLNSTGLEFAADSKNVDDILFLDSKDTTKITIRLKKYIVDGQESFFEELTQGHVIFLKRTIVTLFKGEYDVSRAKHDFRFIKKIDYFLKIDTQIDQLEDLSKESVSAHISLSEKSEAWLAMKKNKLKSEANLIEFLEYYNLTQN